MEIISQVIPKAPIKVTSEYLTAAGMCAAGGYALTVSATALKRTTSTRSEA